MKLAWRQFKQLGAGLGICYTVLLLGALCLGQLDVAFILGMLWGGGFSLLSFLLLGYAVEQAVQRDPHHAQLYMAGQYFLRYLLTAVVLALAILLPFLDGIAAAITLVFPKVVLYGSTIKNLKFVGGKEK